MIKIALVDDHNIFRAGLKALINELDDIQVLLDCENGQEFLDRFIPDLDMVIMDLDMPTLNGLETMEALLREGKETKIIYLSQNKEEGMIAKLMELGARGYLLKESDAGILKEAIYSVRDTGYYFSDLVSQSMLNRLAGKPSIKPTFNYGEVLTEREKEILDLICKEYTTDEIAKELFLSPKTIENHRTRIMDKTGARNLAGLVIYAIKNKLVDVT